MHQQVEKTDGWERVGEYLEQRIAAGSTNLYRELIARAETLVISRAMEQARGSQTEAARILGVSRFTLRTRIRELKLEVRRTLVQAGK